MTLYYETNQLKLKQTYYRRLYSLFFDLDEEANLEAHDYGNAEHKPSHILVENSS